MAIQYDAGPVESLALNKQNVTSLWEINTPLVKVWELSSSTPVGIIV